MTTRNKQVNIYQTGLGEVSVAPASRPRRPKGLVQEIVLELSQNIHDGLIKPGDKLPSESEIMARFDVSRTVVREALSKLQASQLVETRHGIGTFALASPETTNFRIAEQEFATVADVIEVLELRISMEVEASYLAAQRRTASNLATLEESLSEFQQAMDADADTVPQDFRFHMEIAHATNNRHFVDLMTYLGTMIIPRTRVNTASTAPEGRLKFLQMVHHEHTRIFEAIRDQDASAARTAMRTHLTNSMERLKKSRLAVTGALKA